MTVAKTLKTLAIALGGIVGVLVIAVIALVAWLFSGTTHTWSVDTCEFPNGVVVHYWAEVGFDFAVDYYRIEEHGKVVVPATYFANNGTYKPFPKHQYQTSDGKLLAVTHELTGSGERIMIYDTVSKESWPGNVMEDGSHHRPEVKRKWHARYARLKAEHPDLIEDWYFTQEWTANKASEDIGAGAPNPQR